MDRHTPHTKWSDKTEFRFRPILRISRVWKEKVLETNNTKKRLYTLCISCSPFGKLTDSGATKATTEFLYSRRCTVTAPKNGSLDDDDGTGGRKGCPHVCYVCVFLSDIRTEAGHGVEVELVKSGSDLCMAKVAPQPSVGQTREHPKYVC